MITEVSGRCAAFIVCYSYHSKMGPYHMKTLDLWVRALVASQRVLDFGCGPGSFPEILHDNNVVGVDVDLAHLAHGRFRGMVCARGEALPFADRTFDMVICHHSLEHVTGLESALFEIGRVMKPAGKLYISVPEGCSFCDRLYRILLCGGGIFSNSTMRA